MAKERGWLLAKKKNHSIYLIVEVIIFWRQLWWDFAWDTNIFILFGHLERAIHIFFHQIYFFTNFQSFLFQVHNHLTKWLQTAQYIIMHMVIFLSMQNIQPFSVPRVKILFCHCFWIVQWTVMLICPLLGSTWRVYRTVCKPDSSLLFLSQLKTRYIPRGHSACFRESQTLVFSSSVSWKQGTSYETIRTCFSDQKL